jgi:hypothetical protein
MCTNSIHAFDKGHLHAKQDSCIQESFLGSTLWLYYKNISQTLCDADVMSLKGIIVTVILDTAIHVSILLSHIVDSYSLPACIVFMNLHNCADATIETSTWCVFVKHLHIIPHLYGTFAIF